jgi:hypothetical protein
VRQGALKEVSICDVWSSLLAVEDERQNSVQDTFRTVALWAPDVFCLAAALLRVSGAYTSLTRGRVEFQQTDWREDAEHWRTEMTRDTRPGSHAAEGSGDARKRSQPKRSILSMLREVWQKKDFPVSKLFEDRELLDQIFYLLIAADSACLGFGLPWSYGASKDSSWWKSQYLADCQLQPGPFGSSLCKAIHPSRGRVLPKTHTPSTGLTLRSLSHNLCYIEPDECRPMWYTVPDCAVARDHLNLLVIPVPYEIGSGLFTGTQKLGGPHSVFDFKPKETFGNIVWKIMRLCDQAARVGGDINAVVLPELAISSADYRLLRSLLLARKITLIAGLGGPSQDGAIENRFCLDIPLSKSHAVHFRQRKHHRWRIEERQIQQYQISDELDPSRIYWENLRVGERHVCFVALHPDLLATVLICEDLAQYEPVGRLVRAVGPNLVVALLMDGPQVAGRWPERYAAVLTDDPGCSVLTVSSIGMTLRTKNSRHRVDKSRFVALWKDPIGGAQELELKPDASAILLTVTTKQSVEWTADLRACNAHNPRLSAVHQIHDPGMEKGANPYDLCGSVPGISFLGPSEASALARLAQLRVSGVDQNDTSERLLDIISALDTTGFKIAQRMLYQKLKKDGAGRKDDLKKFENVGPEEERQRNCLMRCGVPWKTTPPEEHALAVTAGNILEWADSLSHFSADSTESNLTESHTLSPSMFDKKHRDTAK